MISRLKQMIEYFGSCFPCRRKRPRPNDIESSDQRDASSQNAKRMKPEDSPVSNRPLAANENLTNTPARNNYEDGRIVTLEEITIPSIKRKTIEEMSTRKSKHSNNVQKSSLYLDLKENIPGANISIPNELPLNLSNTRVKLYLDSSEPDTNLAVCSLSLSNYEKSQNEDCVQELAFEKNNNENKQVRINSHEIGSERLAHQQILFFT